MKTIHIRPVRLEDSVQLQKNCFLRNSVEDIQIMVAEDLKRAEHQGGIHLVAEVDGSVIGTVTLLRQAHPLFHHRAELAGLVVHPDYQGSGIARKLVETAEERAAEMGILLLEINCRGGEPAERIYPRFGFLEFGRLPGGIVEPWGEGQVFDQVFFYKNLRLPKQESLQEAV